MNPMITYPPTSNPTYEVNVNIKTAKKSKIN